MTENNDPSSILGSEIEIISERFLINHISINARKLEREFTLISRTDNPDGVDSVFITVPKFLPNLKIFDSDGTILSLIPNKYTISYIEQTISELTDQTLIASFTSLLEDIQERRTYLLWIKLPHDKKFYPNDSRVITMKYDAEKDDGKASFDLELLSVSGHEIFYIIKPPKDYKFDKITIDDDSGNEFKIDCTRDWKNKKENPIYYTKYLDSSTIRVNPNMPVKKSLYYSFTPKKIPLFIKNIISILIAAPFVTMISKFCYSMNDGCPFIPNMIDLDLISTKVLEIDVAVIGATLVMARLISNRDVREKFRWLFYIPIILAILGIIIKI